MVLWEIIILFFWIVLLPSNLCGSFKISQNKYKINLL